VNRLRLAALIALGAACWPAPAVAKIPAPYKNCAAVNSRYPHGIGLPGAHDKTVGVAPVTTFLRSKRLYKLAISYNRGLDRDGDGIACETA
jgi:hypothetical protein